MLGLTNPLPGPSKGMLFCAALIFVVVVWDAEPKKVLQIPLKLDVCIPFFFPKRSLIYVGTCKVQNFYKNPAFIFNSWVHVDFRDK